MEAKTEEVRQDKLYNKLKGGPHGLGDPDDKTLRRVEIDVMIPKKMRTIAHEEKCIEEVANFKQCVKSKNFSMVFRCRSENSALWQCLETWYYNEEFKDRCKIEYLKERSEFRRTGITKKQRKLQTSGM